MTLDEAKGTLAACREEIDGIDRRLVALLNERSRVVERIGAVKANMVYANIMAANGGPIPDDSVRRIFERIIDEMRTLQRTRMGAK